MKLVTYKRMKCKNYACKVHGDVSLGLSEWYCSIQCLNRVNRNWFTQKFNAIMEGVYS